MDYRIEKTKRSIYNAFIGLRSKKVLEKITVKELCETAQINKSTFYVYYHDVYDLSDKIENEIIAQMIEDITNKEDVINDPLEFSRRLFNAYFVHDTLIQTVFSETRAQQLPKKIEASLKEAIFAHFPQYKEDLDYNTKLTYSIYGGFYTYVEYKHLGNESVVKIIGGLSEKIMGTNL